MLCISKCKVISANPALLQHGIYKCSVSNLGLLLAVVNHQVDLAKLQSVVTQQSEHDGAPSPMLVVVIDKMKVVNSPASHKQLREVFQLTQACHALHLLRVLARL